VRDRKAPAKRRAAPPDAHVAFRLDGAILARVDALGPRYSQPWRQATRSDLFRLLILAGLDAVEQPPRKGDRS
jgi:hypothetical protein